MTLCNICTIDNEQKKQINNIPSEAYNSNPS